MRIQLQPFVAATLAVTLLAALAACGERAEESTAATPAAEQQNAEPAEPSAAQGTTTTFGESTPEPQQSPAE